MKITILYGNSLNEKNDFTEAIKNLTNVLQNHHDVDLFLLDEMNLKFCVGCWTCWWKTPGLCIHKDDANQIFKKFINSDFVIFASPVSAGFVSSSLKKITDRLIVLLHPYIQFINNESHHQKRYDKYPDFGLILKRDLITDKEDIQIINEIYKRMAINFHSNFKFQEFIDEFSVEKFNKLFRKELTAVE